MQENGYYRDILMMSPFAYAFHKIILDDKSKPIDYEFIEVNKSFEDLVGLKSEEIAGRRVTSVMPGLRNDSFDWIKAYGEVALNGVEKEFEQFSDRIGRWFKIKAFSPEKYFFTTIFLDVSSEMKQAEDLKNFFSINLDLFCITDHNGNFIKINQTWQNIFGYSPADLEGKTFRDFVHPDDQSSTLHLLTEKRENKKVNKFINRFITSEGNYRFIEWHSIPSGNLIYAAARDITESVREKELMERMIAQNMVFIQSSTSEPDYLQITDLIRDISGARYATFNLFEDDGREFTTKAISGLSDHIKKASRMLGIEFLNKKWSYDPIREEKIKNNSLTVFRRLHQLTGSVLAKPAIQLLERIFDLGQAVVAKIEKNNKMSGDFTLIFQADEELKNRELVLLFCSQVGLFLDRRKTGQALRKNRIELNSLFDEAPVGYHEFDSKGIITRINNTELKFLGYSREELIGKPVWILFKDEETKKNNILSKLAGTIVDLGVYEREVRRKDGSLATMLLEDMFLHDQNGNISGVRTSLMDITRRKKLETDLKTSEEKFRLIVSHSSDLIWNITNDKFFTYNSPSWERVTGYSPASLTGTSYTDIIHPLDLPGCEAFFTHTIREKKVLPLLEYRVKHQDGEWHWHSTTCSPVFDSNGICQYLVGVSRDVTPRKIMEEKLRSSEQNFRTLFETLADMLIIGNLEGKIIYTNQALKDKLKYSDQQLSNLHLIDLHPGGMKEEGKEILNEILLGTRSFCPLPLADSNGNIIPVETRLWLGKWNDQDCIFAIAKDLSTQQEALQKFNRLFDSNPALMAVNRMEDGIFTEVNRAFLEKTGYNREEILGKTSQDLDLLVFPQISPEVSASFRQQGKIKNLELKLRTKRGDLLDGLLSLEIIESQGIKYYLTVMTDITTQKKTETKLTETNIELEAAIAKANDLAEKAKLASEAKSEFLANMSHEIRTPLNGVIGFMDLILNSNLNPLQRQYIDNAHVSAHLLLDLINDILDFSKIEAGKLELDEIKTDVVELLEQASDIVSIGAAKKGVEVLLNIDPKAPRYMDVDPVRLKQIMVNLLGNAVKFTDHGEVELGLRVVQMPTETAKGVYEFSVRDTGIGITPEQQERLFKAFAQADTTTTRKFGGTGLGLVISNKLLQMMQSKLKVESEPENGCRFSFLISKEAELEQATGPLLENRVFKALIIEDNIRNGAILSALLKQWNIIPLLAHNTLEAEDLLQSDPTVDIIIADSTLPGESACEWLKRDSRFQSRNSIPVVLMGLSSDDAKMIEECKTTVPINRLIKPIKHRELQEAIRLIVNPEIKLRTETIINEETYDRSAILTSQPLILIAEDVPLNRVLIIEMIRSVLPTVKIIEACDGREAVTMYELHHPDLILMDVQMPEQDGCEATRDIRHKEEKKGTHVSIVAVTASAIVSERMRCLSAGMDDFLTKPIDRNALNGILKNLFPSSFCKTEESTEVALTEEMHHFNQELLLNRIGNSDSLLEKLKSQAVSQFPEYFEELSAVIVKKDDELLRKISHKIKGAARNMCFERIADFSLEIEELNPPDYNIASFLLSEIRESWEIVRLELYQNAI